MSDSAGPDQVRITRDHAYRSLDAVAEVRARGRWEPSMWAIRLFSFTAGLCVSVISLRWWWAVLVLVLSLAVFAGCALKWDKLRNSSVRVSARQDPFVGARARQSWIPVLVVFLLITPRYFISDPVFVWVHAVVAGVLTAVFCGRMIHRELTGMYSETGGGAGTVADPLLRSVDLLRICAALATAGARDTDTTYEMRSSALAGHAGLPVESLPRHLSSLESVGYVERHRELGSGKGPTVWVTLTRKGEAAFGAHLRELRMLYDGDVPAGNP